MADQNKTSSAEFATAIKVLNDALEVPAVVPGARSAFATGCDKIVDSYVAALQTACEFVKKRAVNYCHPKLTPFGVESESLAWFAGMTRTRVKKAAPNFAQLKHLDGKRTPRFETVDLILGLAAAYSIPAPFESCMKEIRCFAMQTVLVDAFKLLRNTDIAGNRLSRLSLEFLRQAHIAYMRQNPAMISGDKQKEIEPVVAQPRLTYSGQWIQDAAINCEKLLYLTQEPPPLAPAGTEVEVREDSLKQFFHEWFGVYLLTGYVLELRMPQERDIQLGVAGE